MRKILSDVIINLFNTLMMSIHTYTHNNLERFESKIENTWYAFI